MENNHTKNTTQEASAPDIHSLWTEVVIVTVSLTSAQVFLAFVQTIAFIVGMVWANHFIKNREKQDDEEKRQREKRDKEEQQAREERHRQEERDREARNHQERLAREQRDKEEQQAREERHRQEEWEREDRHRQEQLDRELREKITEILHSEYSEIESKGIPDIICKTKQTFEKILIFRGANLCVTGLDVLRYMCQREHFEHFKTPMLEKLYQDLDAICKLFRTFRIKLPLKVVCPKNISEDMAPLIVDLGKMSASFVTGANREPILTVLAYFGQSLNCDEYNENNVVERIPYINELRLCPVDLSTFRCRYEDRTYKPSIKSVVFDSLTVLSHEFRSGKGSEGFQNLVENLWLKHVPQHVSSSIDFQDKNALHVNMLHAVRTLLHLIQSGVITDFLNFKQLMDKMNAQPSLAEKADQMKCVRYIQDVELHLHRLSNTYSHLLKEKDTVDFLVQIEDRIRKFIISKKQLQNSSQ